MAISESDRHDAYLPRIQAPALDVDGIASMLRRRATFIAAVTLACVGICLAWILLSAPRYVASGRILLDLPGAQVGGGASAGSGETSTTAVENQIYVLTSRSVYDRVIAREKLEADPLFGGKSKGILSTLLAGVGLARAVDPHVMALRQLDRAVSIVRNSGSHTVDVNVVTPDRDMSARIANAVMDGYVEEQASAGRQTPPGTAAPLGARLETLQARLRDAEQRYEAFRSENRAIVASGPTNTEKQVSELSGQTGAAEAKVNGLRSTLAQLQRARKTLDAGESRTWVAEEKLARSVTATRRQSSSNSICPKRLGPVIPISSLRGCGLPKQSGCWSNRSGTRFSQQQRNWNRRGLVRTNSRDALKRRNRIR